MNEPCKGPKYVHNERSNPTLNNYHSPLNSIIFNEQFPFKISEKSNENFQKKQENSIKTKILPSSPTKKPIKSPLNLSFFH